MHFEGLLNIYEIQDFTIKKKIKTDILQIHLPCSQLLHKA